MAQETPYKVPDPGNLLRNPAVIGLSLVLAGVAVCDRFNLIDEIVHPRLIKAGPAIILSAQAIDKPFQVVTEPNRPDQRSLKLSAPGRTF